ncbi:MAG: dGTP triphosphohydrolase [Candidatus Zhuqueibacterota bacterium]
MKFEIRNRDHYEELENKILAPFATKSQGAHATRIHAEDEHPYRTAFQRDRDRIIHSRAFRRLKHKQQVFLISDGDHYRTRLTHTLEVSQLSRTLAKALGLNEELVEAIALGHDLGHTPFGHIGEVVLNAILSGKDDLNGLLPGENLGGFKHNYQSVRVVDWIEKKYHFAGLNLTSSVREGILKHTRLLRDLYSYPKMEMRGLNFQIDVATTLEGQVVAVCDEIAQRTHDLEDGIIAKLVSLEQVRQVEIIQRVEAKMAAAAVNTNDEFSYKNYLINGLINLLIDDVITTTLDNIRKFYDRTQRLEYFDVEIVRFSEDIEPLQFQLDRFIHKEIIFKRNADELNAHNKNIVRELFIHFVKNPERTPGYIRKQFVVDPAHTLCSEDIAGNPMNIRTIADYVAGMTDRYALAELNNIAKR